MFTFGLNRGRSMDQINDTLVCFHQNYRHDAADHRRRRRVQAVLVDSGVDKYIASMMHEEPMSLYAVDGVVYRGGAAYRAGTATVAAITAGGIAAMIATTGVSLN